MWDLLNADNGQSAGGLPSDNPFVGLGGGVIQEDLALGFRDPVRFAFDTATGRLLVGDITNDLEEVNPVVSAATTEPQRGDTLFQSQWQRSRLRLAQDLVQMRAANPDRSNRPA